MNEKLIVNGNPVSQGGVSVLGKQGEYGIDATYDFSDWVDEFGAGSIGWAFRRPNENTSYLLPSTEDENISTITFTETELQYSGECKLELFYVNEGETEKRISVTYRFMIAPSLQNIGEVPEPWQAYVEQVHQDAEDVKRIKEEIDSLQFRITDEGILEVNI